MRKLLFFLFAVLNLYSDANIKEIRIHDSIAKSMFSSNDIKTYISSKDLRLKISQHSKHMKISSKEEASYIILSDNIAIDNPNAVLFVTNYKLLKKHKNAVGAFYWKKGRPTIIFIKERLQMESIELSSSFNKYYENEKCLYELCF